MKKEEIDRQQFEKILDCIIASLMKQGLKVTTMDSIASSLKMSKRTLYEMFGSKEDMFREVHQYFHKKIGEAHKEIFESSGNIMEAIIRCFLYNRDLMSNVSADFLKDIEQYSNHSEILSDCKQRHLHQNLYDVLKRGVDEGYFRPDINLEIQSRMIILQMQSLKMAPQLFPEDISLLEVYDNIIIGLLRAVSTQKGLGELEKAVESLSQRR